MARIVNKLPKKPTSHAAVLSWRMTTHILARSDAGFVLEHAREMMRVVEAEHVCRFANAAAAYEDVFG